MFSRGARIQKTLTDLRSHRIPFITNNLRFKFACYFKRSIVKNLYFFRSRKDRSGYFNAHMHNK